MAKKRKKTSQKSKGCLTVLLGVFIISLALAIYSFAWIPGIVALIYFATRKNIEPKSKKIRIAISGTVVVTSLLVFIASFSSPTLEELNIELSETEYDINDTPKLTLSLTPDDGEINELVISDNEIVELKYEYDVATLSFKESGTVTFSVTANGEIESNSITLTIIDKEAILQQQEAEEAARIAAEEEAARIAAEEEAARIAAEEEAARIAAEEEAARIAAEEEAKKQAELAEQEQTDISSDSDSYTDTNSTSSTMVWVDDTAKRYHAKNGCGMDNAYQVTLDEAVAMGKTPCGRCY